MGDLPRKFYEQLFRLNEWNFNDGEYARRKKEIVTWMQVLIYDPLRGYLSPNIEDDDPVVASQFTQVVTIFLISDNMKDAWEKFERLNKPQKAPFEFDEKGRSIVPIDESSLTEFDRNVIKMLNHKPEKK